MGKIIQKLINVFMSFITVLSLFVGTMQPAPALAAHSQEVVAQSVSISAESAAQNKSMTPIIAAEYAAILTGCESAENGGGEGIKCVIRLVIDILTVLVGIVGVIGIVIVGIQYLTAGGNEEQTRKAKRRLFEIIIGIAVYALAAALLRWLLPGYSPGNNSTSLIPTIIAGV